MVMSQNNRKHTILEEHSTYKTIIDSTTIEISRNAIHQRNRKWKPKQEKFKLSKKKKKERNAGYYGQQRRPWAARERRAYRSEPKHRRQRPRTSLLSEWGVFCSKWASGESEAEKKARTTTTPTKISGTEPPIWHRRSSSSRPPSLQPPRPQVQTLTLDFTERDALWSCSTNSL